jgi:hypothetical protein
MEVSMSLLPICHCQRRPTVGCHQLEEGVMGKAIGVKVVSSKEAGRVDDGAPHPIRKDERRNGQRMDLDHIMLELWKVILVLGKQLVRHLLDLGQR